MVISSLPKAFKLNLEIQPMGMLSGGRKAKGKAKHWFKSRVQTTESEGAPRCSVLNWEAGEVSA